MNEEAHGVMHEDIQGLGAASPPPVRIAWSKEEQAFRVVDGVRNRTTPSPANRGRSVVAGESTDSLYAAVMAFGSHWEEVPNRRDIEKQLTARREILDATLGQPQSAALLLLPDFLTHWRRKLDDMVNRDTQPQLSQDVVALLCKEFKQLAETEFSMGGIIHARSSLGQCIRLARQHDLETKATIVSGAKAVLMECIRFHKQLKLCTASLKRQSVPLSIRHKILAMLQRLQTLAPHCVDIVALSASLLMEMHRSREVVRLLSGFAFTETSAELTLPYVRALEYEGFYNDSISTASAFCQKQPTTNDDKMLQVLKTHVVTLKSVLLSKATAEDALVQSQFEQAELEFSEALRRTPIKSRKLRACLLLGRANARIALEQMLSARHDLEESLALDGSNQLTRLRLQTVHLALESHRIQRRLDVVTRS